MARLTSAVLVGALTRRVHQQGGSAMVLARGDATAGAILVLALERGANPRFFERGVGPDGQPALIATGPRTLADDGEVTAYWQRRRSQDGDLWVVELDVAAAERFAAETICAG
ncbi:DUF1491 family protein [Sphingomonas hengshuiensis]|uniref:DUF1491 domain-containing protein n=1 Tax=Sphingomonas hengshuiensis TaxID=1609977 RepID=A0A7U4JB55_9SPHN|nr:DUF1491 family protein [Sphingomonas hengshuiensis]AJP73591.1 hypothetical protein TS85_20010 [Sphingomonas hengshuiensis]